MEAKQQIKNQKKKTHGLSQGNQDRLSDLPNCLIIHLLSFLELKDVVQTSVLSKRWKPLWNQVDNIIIRCHFEPDFTIPHNPLRKQVKRYYASVHKTLTNISRIRNFSLTGFHSFGYNFPDMVWKWVEYALKLNVETMDLDYMGIASNPPCSLFQSSSLTQLEISNAKDALCWETPIDLPLLKSLSLSNIYLRDTDVEEMLVGCPVLETLVLTDVKLLNVMRIISQSLKTVKLMDVNYLGLCVDYFLEIRAPLLEELEIWGDFGATKCVLADLYSLVKARLLANICPPIFVDDDGDDLERDDIQSIELEREFNLDMIPIVEEVLKSVCHVGELIIGGNLLQVLTMLMPDKPSVTLMCNHVTIVSPLCQYDLPGIVYLLEATPYLEALIVDVYCPEDISLTDQMMEALSVNHLHMISHARWNIFHLKNIVISYQGIPCVDCPPQFVQFGGKCFDFELIDYILKSCVALERLTLWSPKVCSNQTECLKPDCAFQYVNQLSSKLLMHSLPPSENAEWVLNKWELNQQFVFDYVKLHIYAF